MDEKEVSEMQEEMMTVLVVEPMKAPYVKIIPNELEDLQQAVGGDIEMTYPFEDEVGVLLNGNGKFEGLPLNRALYDDRGQVYDAIAGTFLVVGLTEDDFTSLTPEQIEKAKEVCGTDLDASAVWIKQQLFYMTPEDVLQFHNLVYSYRDAAYKYGLWTAAGIMMEAGCSDDSFSDFRMWLIAQGKESLPYT
jgi:hypothetical protein